MTVPVSIVPAHIQHVITMMLHHFPPSLGFTSVYEQIKYKNLLTPFKLLKELAGIAKILNICAEKVKDHPEYVPILCEALTISR